MQYQVPTQLDKTPPVTGATRFNTDFNVIEVFTGTRWQAAIMKEETWEQVLYRCCTSGGMGHDSLVEEMAMKRMQSQFPGPYTLEWYMSAKYLRQLLRPKFADPQEEVMWKLKYS